MPDTEKFLSELIRFPSTPGQELEAMEFLYQQFTKLGIETQKVTLPKSIVNDPDYSSTIPGIKYQGRFNLRIVRKGNGQCKKLLLNTHIDVVPPSEGMTDAYEGKVVDKVVYGRGACDCKGQAATVYLLFRLLKELDIEMAGDIVAHLVVEEENGGNGSLAMVRTAEQANACIVLEPTECRIMTSIRGAVWFKIKFLGKAGHSGEAGQNRNALLMATKAIKILEEYHKQLLEQSRCIELFDKYENPMPITFGHLEAGNWPASAPNYAILEGVLGFLPNKTKEQICDEVQQVLFNGIDFLNEDNCKLTFTYRHDCSIVDADHDIIKAILKAGQDCGLDIKIDAMTASCDAWFYNNQLKIPSVVFGPGTLKVAHSKEEHIKMSEIKTAAEILGHSVINYCGTD